MNWLSATAPDRETFERLASQAFAELPPAFRARLGGLAILIEDFPDDDTLDAMEIEDPYDLLGLYHGVDLARRSVADAPVDQDRIFLFRRPILDYWAEHDETLGHVIAHVLIHEIGHHFGLSDDEMEAIEASVD